ncbi:MAG: hypothetical protein AVDCRST_MAG89-1263, partial [uncultured Gemmatimonadetes bacterium]
RRSRRSLAGRSGSSGGEYPLFRRARSSCDSGATRHDSGPVRRSPGHQCKDAAELGAGPPRSKRARHAPAADRGEASGDPAGSGCLV